MIFPKLQFPHISRIFSALCLWSLLFTLISFNISIGVSKPLAHSDKIFQIFTRPFSAREHEALARTLWNSGARTLAGQELALGAELSPVLGASTKAETQREEEAIIFWQNVLTSHPDYRDAYIQLAALTYGQGNIAQSRAYLVRAQTLDPNNTTVTRFVNFTSKLLE